MNPYRFTLALASIASGALAIYLSHVRKTRQSAPTPAVTYKTATFETSGAETVNQFNDMVAMAKFLDTTKRELKECIHAAVIHDSNNRPPRPPKGLTPDEVIAWKKQDENIAAHKARIVYQETIMELEERVKRFGNDNYPFRWDVYRHIIAADNDIVMLALSLGSEDPDPDVEYDVDIDTLRELIDGIDRVENTINKNISLARNPHH